MSQTPNLGVVHALTSTAIATAYAAGTLSAALLIANGKRVRFRVKFVRGATAITAVKVKLKAALTDTAADYQDIPSTLDDATPTVEIEHTLTVGASTTGYLTFYADMAGWGAFKLDVKGVTNAGAATDSVEITGRVA